jgi:hypothetical protein
VSHAPNAFQTMICETCGSYDPQQDYTPEGYMPRNRIIRDFGGNRLCLDEFHRTCLTAAQWWAAAGKIRYAEIRESK